MIGAVCSINSNVYQAYQDAYPSMVDKSLMWSSFFFLYIRQRKKRDKKGDEEDEEGDKEDEGEDKEVEEEK